MKHVTSKSEIYNNLMAVAKVINSKNSIAILSNIVFKIENNIISLTASDGENTMNTTMRLMESEGNEEFCIYGDDVIKAIAGIPDQPITLDVNKNDSRMDVVYSNGRFSLPIQKTEEYPATSEVGQDSTTFTLTSAALLDNITRTIFATANDEIRPVMCGCFFDLQQDHIAIVASDGHKLVRNKIFGEGNEKPSSFILPKKPANLLKGLLPKDDEITVEIVFDARNARITCGEKVITCRLIEGRYPNYNSVIPKDNNNELTVDRMAFISALKRVQPFTSGASNLVRLSIDNNILKLYAEDFDFSKKASETIVCSYEGRPISIGFKCSALIEILSNIEGQSAVIKLSDPSRAGVVVPFEQPNEQEVLMLIMPMMIEN